MKTPSRGRPGASTSPSHATSLPTAQWGAAPSPQRCAKSGPAPRGAREAPRRAAPTQRCPTSQRCPGAFAFGQVSAQPAHQSILVRAAGPRYRGQPRAGQEPGPGRPAPRLPGAAGAGSGSGGAASRPLSGRKRKPSGEAVPRSAAPGEAPRACRRSFGPGQGSAARPRSTWGLTGPKNPPAGSANASPNGGRSGTQSPG